jgi:nucleoside-diphosphate-sugar epimerase
MTVVLVTGAGGTLGRHLVSALAAPASGMRVLALDQRDVVVAPGLAVEVLRVPCGGPFDPTSRQLLAQVTHLTHLAASMSTEQAPAQGRWLSLYDPVADLRRLLAALPALRHITFASSYMVYATPPTGPLTEHHPQCPINVYAWRKCAVEAYLASLSIATCRLRFAGIYGPGVPTDLGRSLTELVRVLVEGGRLRPYRPGTGLRNHLYLTDAVEALVRSVREEWSGAYNVAGPRAFSLREAITILTAATDRAVPVEWQDSDAASWDAIMDTSALSARYGFRPQTSPQQGLPAYYRWASAARG